MQNGFMSRMLLYLSFSLSSMNCYDAILTVTISEQVLTFTSDSSCNEEFMGHIVAITNAPPLSNRRYQG
jgi:hypothetical protein